MEKPSSIRMISNTHRIFSLFILTFIVALISVSVGTAQIEISEIFEILLGNSQNEQLRQIVLQIRLPRVVYAILIGGGLSICGAVFQAILTNPLAEPYILGISSGGTFGAVMSFVLGLSFIWTQVFALSGSFLVMLLVFYLGRRYGDLEPNTLLLSGVMVGAFFSAAILLLIIYLNDSLRTAVFWMVGSLSFVKMENLPFVLVTTIIITMFLSVNSHKFNIITLGNESAKSLGVSTTLLKNSSYFAASLMVGTIVSVSGIIGFVGLLVPHVCRLIWGVDNRIIIPSSFFIGAIYLTITDTVARTVISPLELPVGAITAFLGAPIFIYLLRTRFTLD